MGRRPSITGKRAALPGLTIQFAMDLFSGQMFQKERFIKIRKLLKEASKGIKFHSKTFEEAMPLILGLTEDRGFSNIIDFFQLLDLLSNAGDVSFLASEGFLPSGQRSNSRGGLCRYFKALHQSRPQSRQDRRCGRTGSHGRVRV